jgi:hypothetical protein
VATALDSPVAGLDVGTDIGDGTGLHIDASNGVRLGDVTAVGTDRTEGHVVVVHFLLVIREHGPGLLAVFQEMPRHILEFTRFVQFGVRDRLDGKRHEIGASLDEVREVRAIGVTAAERVRNRGIGLTEIPT